MLSDSCNSCSCGLLGHRQLFPWSPLQPMSRELLSWGFLPQPSGTASNKLSCGLAWEVIKQALVCRLFLSAACKPSEPLTTCCSLGFWHFHFGSGHQHYSNWQVNCFSTVKTKQQQGLGIAGALWLHHHKGKYLLFI